eukprot:gene27511-34238_t
MKQSGSTSGLKPSHMWEAHRRMQQDGKVGRLSDSAFMFSGTHTTESDLFDSSIHDLIGGDEGEYEGEKEES